MHPDPEKILRSKRTTRAKTAELKNTPTAVNDTPAELTVEEEENSAKTINEDDRADDADDTGTSRLEGDLVDLEPLLRDAVVLSLPFQPLCREDCPGLCTECGARLADDPGHQHEDAIDPRWAALRGLTQTDDDSRTSGEPEE